MFIAMFLEQMLFIRLVYCGSWTIQLKSYDMIHLVEATHIRHYNQKKIFLINLELKLEKHLDII